MKAVGRLTVVRSSTKQRQSVVIAIVMSYREPKRVLLHSNEDGLDFSIRGGSEHGLPIVVSSIENNSATSKTELCVGAEILKINGVMLHQCKHTEAVRLLTESKTVDLVFRRNTLFESKTLRSDLLARQLIFAA
jgi:C-terminal processing protease CtpA/Prc